MVDADLVNKMYMDINMIRVQNWVRMFWIWPALNVSALSFA